MKKFKELERNDDLYIISVNKLDNAVDFKKSKISAVLPDRNSLSNVMIFFKDSVTDTLSTPGDKSHVKIDGSKGIQKHYFTTPEVIDEFLKEEIDTQRKFITDLESLSEEIWKTSKEGSELRLTAGKIYRYKGYSSSSFIISKSGEAYDWDGYRIPTIKGDSTDIREATPKEAIDFFEKLTKTIKARQYKDYIIGNLEKCGLTWNPEIEEIIKL